MIYDPNLSPKQLECVKDFKNDEIDEFFDYGGARSTKTSFWCRMFIERSLIFPGAKHLFCRYRKRHLKTNLYLQTFMPIMRACVPAHQYKINETELLVKFYNGSMIFFEGLDDKERTQEIIMGSDFAGILVNEGIKTSYGSYQDLKTRLSQYIYDLKPIIAMDVQPRKRHWTYDYFMKGIDPVSKKPHNSRVKTRKWLPEDNPWLDPRYITTRLDTLTGAKKAQMRYGEFVDPEGLVYPDFQKCIVDPYPIPDDAPRFAAMDFGTLSSKFSCVFWAYIKETHIVVQYAEYSAQNKSMNQIIPELVKMGIRNMESIVTDHQGGERAILTEEGIPHQPADKDISSGVDLFQSFQNGSYGVKFQVFSTCKETQDEALNYEIDEKTGKPKKLDAQDDHMDASRYNCKNVARLIKRREVFVDAV